MHMDMYVYSTYMTLYMYVPVHITKLLHTVEPRLIIQTYMYNMQTLRHLYDIVHVHLCVHISVEFIGKAIRLLR